MSHILDRLFQSNSDTDIRIRKGAMNKAAAIFYEDLLRPEDHLAPLPVVPLRKKRFAQAMEIFNALCVPEGGGCEQATRSKLVATTIQELRRATCRLQPVGLAAEDQEEAIELVRSLMVIPEVLVPDHLLEVIMALEHLTTSAAASKSLHETQLSVAGLWEALVNRSGDSVILWNSLFSCFKFILRPEWDAHQTIQRLYLEMIGTLSTRVTFSGGTRSGAPGFLSIDEILGLIRTLLSSKRYCAIAEIGLGLAIKIMRQSRENEAHRLELDYYFWFKWMEQTHFLHPSLLLASITFLTELIEEDVNLSRANNLPEAQSEKMTEIITNFKYRLSTAPDCWGGLQQLIIFFTKLENIIKTS